MCEVWIRVVDTKPYRSFVMLGLGCVTAMLFKASAPKDQYVTIGMLRRAEMINKGSSTGAK